jgi:DNA-binding transcriptional MocR family regulator
MLLWPLKLEGVLRVSSPSYLKAQRIPKHLQRHLFNMAKVKEATKQSRKKQRNTYIPATGMCESQRDAVNHLGLSSKGVWKAKQVQEREHRRLRNAERKERILIKTVEKTNPVSPNKWPVKKGAKTVQMFPFQEFPAEIRDMIYQYSLLKLNNVKPALLNALGAFPALHKEASYV